MIEIVSSANPKFKLAMKLHERRGRQQQQKILIDGIREVRYAMQSGIEIETLFVSNSVLAEQIEHVTELVNSTAGSAFYLAQDLFGRLSYGQRNSQVIAIAKTPKRSLDHLQINSPAFLVVVEGIEKPGNLGAIARTVDAVGADGMILVDCVTEAFNPNAIRASMGTVLSRRVVASSSDRLMPWLKTNHIRSYAAWVDDSQSYHQADFRESIAIVLGSEAKGLSRQWTGESVKKISLPMRGTADSLNVSTTAAVLLYEVWRQRQF